MVRRVVDKKRQTRRRKPMRGGVDGADVCGNPDLQAAFRLHTEADIDHDADKPKGQPHKLTIPAMGLSRIFGKKDGYVRDYSKINEDEVSNYFLVTHAHDLVYKSQRIQDKIKFQTSTITDGFITPFDPFSGEAVMNFRDAGPVLPLGLNAVSGSSAIDPANRTATNMVSYSYEPDIYIPGCFFGLDESHVKNVLLRRFRSNLTTCHVQCGIQYSETGGRPYKWIDMASMEEGEDESVVKTPKFINRPTGYLAGNGGNAKLKNSPKDIPYYIGKLLGDALQVYILLPFTLQRSEPNADPKMMPNLAYPVAKQLNTGRPVSYLFLSTLDRLEYVRAVVLGLATTYVGPKDPVTKIRDGVFVPGFEQSKSDAELYEDFRKRIAAVINTTTERYDITLASLEESVKTGSFDVRYSMMGGTQQIREGDQSAAAFAAINVCINNVKKARDRTISEMNEIARAYPAGKVDLLSSARTDYIAINSKVAALSPNGRMIGTRPGAPTGNVKQKLKILSTETEDLVIDFMKIFQNIKSGRDAGVAEWNPSPVALDVEPELPIQMTGGAYDLAATTYSWDGIKWSSKIVSAFTHQIYSDNARAIGFKKQTLEPILLPRDGSRYCHIEQDIANALDIKDAVSKAVPEESIKVNNDDIVRGFATSGFKQPPIEVSDPWTWENVFMSMMNLKNSDVDPAVSVPAINSELAEFICFATNEPIPTPKGFLISLAVLTTATSPEQSKFIEDQTLVYTLKTQAETILQSLTTPPPAQIEFREMNRTEAFKQAQAARTLATFANPVAVIPAPALGTKQPRGVVTIADFPRPEPKPGVEYSMNSPPPKSARIGGHRTFRRRRLPKLL
jgi:hypothetical protein